ncbi:vWA domain-containing protein [Legionella gresilensis]|uniref:vWA domain-containing protein n=1 Tax=Legionella gresilensis TaxID=91823 RepID=UPI0010411F6A|nr:VWA domain-containing protein [Legionella gresilensis]
MFELAAPWLLLLIILPFLIWYFLPPAALILPAALKLPFYQALQSIIAKEKLTLARANRIGLFFIIWTLIVLAAAGPRWIGEPIPLAREGRNIMMVLDLSGSMELNDMLLNGQPVSRLTVVKRAAEEFVRARVGDRIGLILFGSQAYLQTPLTFDRHSVLMRLDDATVGLAGKTTSIGDALGLAVKRLQDVPPASRVIILLTDGANNSGVLNPLKSAELAKQDNIKVYTIGLGSEAELQIPNDPFFSFNAGADLDEQTLQEIAKLTGGRYFRATDTQSLQEIYNKINKLETTSHEQVSARPKKEYYPWPLGMAFVFFLYWLSEKAGLINRFQLPWNRRTMNEVTQ